MAAPPTRLNGLVRPRYFDRQLVEAADLTLDQRHDDARLARLRRYVLGWGIVTGLDVTLARDGVRIAAGYAVTPLGEEVYLPEAIPVPDLIALFHAACGGGARGCEDLAGGGRGDDGTVRRAGTLALRPAWRASNPRAAVPDGCGHPGNAMHASRDCGQVVVDILCAAAPPRVRDEDRLRRQIAGIEPVVVPDDGQNHIVVAGFTVADGRIVLDPSPRRRLLPLELVEDWLLTALTGIGYAKIEVDFMVA